VSRFLMAHQHRLYSAIQVGCSGKYTTEDKLKTHKIHKLNATQKKQTTQNTAKLPGSVKWIDTWLDNL